MRGPTGRTSAGIFSHFLTFTSNVKQFNLFSGTNKETETSQAESDEKKVQVEAETSGTTSHVQSESSECVTEKREFPSKQSI